MVGIVGNDKAYWNDFISNLVKCNIRLHDLGDRVVWIHSPLGTYALKYGYNFLIQGKVHEESVWWWKSVWRYHCPLKTKIFMWFLLINKVLTWDVIQRKFREGLCNNDEETNVHIAVNCPYTKSVWVEIESKLNAQDIWNGEIMEDCLKN